MTRLGARPPRANLSDRRTGGSVLVLAIASVLVLFP